MGDTQQPPWLAYAKAAARPPAPSGAPWLAYRSPAAPAFGADPLSDLIPEGDRSPRIASGSVGDLVGEGGVEAARSGILGATGVAAGVPQAVAGMASGLRTAAPRVASEAEAPMQAGNAPVGQAPNAWSMMQRDQARADQQSIQAATAAPSAPGPIERGASAAARTIQSVGDEAASKLPQTPHLNRFARAIASQAGGFAPLLGAIMAGTALAGPPGGVVAGIAAAGLGTYQQNYRTLRAQGATPEEAHQKAVAPALWSAGVMSLPAGELVGSLTPEIAQPVARWAAHVAATSGTMVGFNAVSQAATNLATGRPLGEGITPENLLAGAVVGAGMGAFGGRGGETEAAAPQAVHPQAQAEPSPGMPAAEADDFLHLMGGVRTLDSIKQFGSAGEPEAQAPTPEAKAVAPEPAAPMPAPRPEPAAPAPEAAPAPAPEVAPTATAAPARVRTVDQIMQEDGVGPKKAAAIQATEFASLPTARVVTPEEVAARKVGVQLAPPARAALPPPEDIPVPRPPPKAQSMMAFLRGRGGVKDESGELEARDVRRWYPGFVNNRAGMPLDYAREAAENEGFLRPGSDINDFLAAIDEHQSGRPVYRAADIADQMAHEDAIRAIDERDRHDEVRRTVASVADDEGLTLSPAQIARAAEWVATDGVDPGDAAWRVATEFPEQPGTEVPEDEEIPGFAQGRRLPLPLGGPDLFGRPEAEPRRSGAPEPTVRTDQRQAEMPGMERSAVQAQAARDQAGRGALTATATQRAADEGLFARPEPTQPGLPEPPEHGNAGKAFAEEAPQGVPAREAAERWVVGRGLEDGTERLVAIDGATDRVLGAQHDRKAGGVSLPGGLRPAAADPNSSIEIHHNHPRSTPISQEDLQFAADWPGIKKVVAYAHDGRVSEAGIGPTLLGLPRRERLAALNRAWQKAVDFLKPMVRSAYNSGKISSKEAETTWHESILRRLHDQGYIEYASSHEVPHHVAAELRIPATLPDRSTGAVRGTGRDQGVYPRSGAIARTETAGVPIGVERGSAQPSPSVGRQASFNLSEEQPRLDLSPPAPVKDEDDLAGRLAKLPVVGRAAAGLAHALSSPENSVESIKALVAPMAQGARLDPEIVKARATVKDFQNHLSYVEAEGRRVVEYLTKHYTPAQHRDIFNAMYAEELAEKNGEAAGERGVAGLPPDQQKVAESLRTAAHQTALEAKRLGMPMPDRIPRWYVPHNVTGLDDPTRENVHTVRDARTLALATMNLQRAIVGRRLINSIRDAGVAAGGVPFVQEGAVPGIGRPLNPFGREVSTSTPNLRQRKYQTIEETEAAARRIPERQDDYFTIPENPAFWRSYVVGTDADGKPIYQRVPIYAHESWEGPLRSVMWGKTNPVFAGLMSLKSKAMATMLYGVAHVGVVSSRVMTVSPRLIHMGLDGAAARRDPELLRDAYLHGARLLGHRPGPMGVSSFEEPQLEAGRSWTAKGAGAVVGRIGGEDAAIRTKMAIDRAGDFAHGTLIWDRLADIQMGLYRRETQVEMAHGLPEDVAKLVAADRANVFIGAMPKEAMSHGATVAANLAMFSRTYRLASAGILKRAIMGLPRDVQAQIYNDPETRPFLAAANNAARRGVMVALARDIAMWYVGNALAQSAFTVLRGGDQQTGTIWGRMADEFGKVAADPGRDLNPFAILDAIDPLSENEPGKTDRILVGHGKRGTAVYLRAPFGKTFADTVGMLFHPVQSAESMASPYLHVVGALGQHNEFGRLIRDPYASLPADAVQAARNLAVGAFRSFTPATAISAFYDLMTGASEGAARDVGVIVGGGLGASLSRGYPGGELQGELHAAQVSHQFKMQAIRARARDMAQRGDQAGAQAALVAGGLTPIGAAREVRAWETPSRVTPGRLRSVMRYATPEQRKAIERDLHRAGR